MIFLFKVIVHFSLFPPVKQEEITSSPAPSSPPANLNLVQRRNSNYLTDCFISRKRTTTTFAVITNNIPV